MPTVAPFPHCLPCYGAATILLAMLTAPAMPAAPGLPEKVSFNRDIRPIMSDTCFHCHGFDPNTREAGLRLDLREAAIAPTEDGVIGIVPGDPDASTIIQRIFDEGDPMPPEKAHKPLTSRQKDLFRLWVAQGAEYEPHWAYAPLATPALPPTQAQVAHPIDAFIQAKLAEKNIKPSAAAAPEKLIRRLSLDLTGLPPTPAEVAAFVTDASRDPQAAAEKAAQRLLKSPHFGERMAVWWLDIARFADTVGFHGDQNQRIFPYRDYVIEAFNSNKPFDQFTIEQLAGDLLPHPTPEQLVATGYNRLNMMTREGGAQPKEYLAKYGAERVRSVAAAWFGSTFGCAECHDHKFDPIKTRDFYELQSFFADVKQWGVYSDYGYTKNPELQGFNNEFPFPPEIEVTSSYLQRRHEQAVAALDSHLADQLSLLATSNAQTTALAAWQRDIANFLKKNPSGWTTPPLTAEVTTNSKPVKGGVRILADGQQVQLSKALNAKTGALHVTVALPAPLRVAAIRLDVVTEGTAGDTLKEVLGTSTTLTKVEIVRADGKRSPLRTSIGNATARRPSYVSGVEVPGIDAEWKLPSTLPPQSLHAVWLLDRPVILSAGEQLALTLTGSTLAPLQFAFSPLADLNPLKSATPDQVAAFTTPEKKRTPDQERRVQDAFLVATATDSTLTDLAARVRELNEGRTWSLITQAQEPLTVRVLARGNWQDESGPVVLPSTPSFLPGRLESTDESRLTRLDLARWIVSDANPITARTVMNRLWQIYFGTGLSAVVDDLGSQGEPPSHPELLDWLASEFRRSGWDMRHMIQLITTSATYQQSSSLRPELAEADPANRLLASQNPRRLEAEFIRDNALAIAGVLNADAIGGPSVRPYQPEGYYEALQFPSRVYQASSGSEQYRRGLYMHWQRTFLHPMLANFDAPARDECAALRTVSNTPQQALTLLNDPTFVEAARLFAARLLADSAATSDSERIDLAFQTALSRPAKPAEAESLTRFLATQRDYYQSQPDDTAKLLAIGQSPPPAQPTADLAAWTQLCRVLLNAQETVTRY